MFVGETGVGRIIQKTAEIMASGQDPKAAGVIPLDVIQRYVNLWYTLSLDLFGGEEGRGTMALTFLPTHFSKIRLQGDVISSELSDSLSYGGFLQVEVIAGAHAPHQF